MTMRRIAYSIAIFLFGIQGLSAATANWAKYAKNPDEWYSDAEGKQIAENILSWQSDLGSWPKNLDTTAERFSGDRKTIKGTFDNGATVGEMTFLARAFGVNKDPRFRQAFIKGLGHILEAQYPTGGWPQSYPPGSQYHRHITFNDDAMVHLMEFLREVSAGKQYAFVDEVLRQRSHDRFEAGIECILRCQIRAEGQLTVWCAQHDELDYKPRPARAFELVSLSGAESARILGLLMSLDHPGREVMRSIEAGVAWYERAKLTGIRQTKVDGDKRIVKDPSAPPLWARFYEIENNRPIFSGRDSVKKYDISEIESERRNGYAWYGNWGDKVAGDYAKWKEKWPAAKDSLQEPLRVAVIGDSTVCDYPAAEPTRGWGQYLGEHWNGKVRVINMAKSGRSTKTFIAEGLWDRTLKEQPDFVLIQFGHNDSHGAGKPESTDAAADYSDYLRKYVDEARRIGATPILISPMHRRTFGADGKLTDILGPYAQAMKSVAAEKRAAFIDLHQSSGQLFQQLGDDKSAELANKPGDRTHFNEKGARAMADLVWRDLPRAEPRLR